MKRRRRNSELFLAAEERQAIRETPPYTLGSSLEGPLGVYGPVCRMKLDPALSLSRRYFADCAKHGDREGALAHLRRCISLEKCIEGYDWQLSIVAAEMVYAQFNKPRAASRIDAALAELKAQVQKLKLSLAATRGEHVLAEVEAALLRLELAARKRAA